MRVLVDELPKVPIDCIFAQQDVEMGYACSLAVNLANNRGWTDFSDSSTQYFCKCSMISNLGCPYLQKR